MPSPFAAGSGRLSEAGASEVASPACCAGSADAPPAVAVSGSGLEPAAPTAADAVSGSGLAAGAPSGATSIVAYQRDTRTPHGQGAEILASAQGVPWRCWRVSGEGPRDSHCARGTTRPRRRVTVVAPVLDR